MWLIVAHTKDWIDSRQWGHTINQQTKDALRDLRREWANFEHYDPFFLNENRAEAGFALENQVGGISS
jgi:hypothetical protein